MAYGCQGSRLTIRRLTSTFQLSEGLFNDSSEAYSNFEEKLHIAAGKEWYSESEREVGRGSGAELGGGEPGRKGTI